MSRLQKPRTVSIKLAKYVRQHVGESLFDIVLVASAAGSGHKTITSCPAMSASRASSLSPHAADLIRFLDLSDPFTVPSRVFVFCDEFLQSF